MRITAVPYYGGKYRHLGWLLPNLPLDKPQHFVDVFGGGGSVILNREPVKLETYNDLDGEVVNFFTMLRDRGPELLEKLMLTPNSRSEFQRMLATNPTEPLERARRYYALVRQSRVFSPRSHAGDWRTRVKPRRHEWKVGNLVPVIDRLARIQIECLPALSILDKYDRPTTLFYCDPPYLHRTRAQTNRYLGEMTESQHFELAAKLNGCDARVAISGYPSELYQELYSGWRVVTKDTYTSVDSSANPRVESLWMNYEKDGQKYL